MARLPYLEKKDLPADQQDLLKREITLFKCMVHSPNAVRAFQGLGGFIRHKSRLDGRLREIAILAVGWITQAPYEWSHHVKIGQEFGVTEADIQGVIAACDGEASSLEPVAKLIVKAAREMTESLAVSDGTFAELRQAFDDERLTDLVITMAFYNAVVRYLGTMRIDVEPEYQPYLDRFPMRNPMY
ncbi:MAG: carboxymuconolactone decarboxylase family protein [Hyphomicrobiaceae bacterium]|nr:carboxymuconolactone decarboxylase family protein [Hyphomicrobiaceae bacterium]